MSVVRESILTHSCPNTLLPHLNTLSHHPHPSATLFLPHPHHNLPLPYPPRPFPYFLPSSFIFFFTFCCPQPFLTSLRHFCSFPSSSLTPCTQVVAYLRQKANSLHLFPSLLMRTGGGRLETKSKQSAPPFLPPHAHRWWPT